LCPCSVLRTLAYVYGGGEVVEVIAYRPAEALQVFPLGRSLLYEKLRTGEIASFRVGRARFIPRQSLLEYMERRLTDEREREAAGHAG
jgi:excisionase family DNA binding protein